MNGALSGVPHVPQTQLSQPSETQRPRMTNKLISECKNLEKLSLDINRDLSNGLIDGFTQEFPGFS